ncbi:hypothetical protein GCM10009610_39240 [Pseudonocardia xinjiangensis]
MRTRAGAGTDVPVVRRALEELESWLTGSDERERSAPTARARHPEEIDVQSVSRTERPVCAHLRLHRFRREHPLRRGCRGVVEPGLPAAPNGSGRQALTRL